MGTQIDCVATRLAEARQAKGYTVPELARRAVVDADTIRKIEKYGFNERRLSSLLRLERALGLPRMALVELPTGNTVSEQLRRARLLKTMSCSDVDSHAQVAQGSMLKAERAGHRVSKPKLATLAHFLGLNVGAILFQQAREREALWKENDIQSVVHNALEASVWRKKDFCELTKIDRHRLTRFFNYQCGLDPSEVIRMCQYLRIPPQRANPLIKTHYSRFNPSHPNKR